MVIVNAGSYEFSDRLVINDAVICTVNILDVIKTTVPIRKTPHHYKDADAEKERDSQH
jgi:hypothetical protein